jgi:uncharacterized membrane protein YozB (DUF420 family)
MFDITVLPTVNATLNGLATILLVSGFVAIRMRRIAWHRAFMLSAFVASVLFLISYGIYHTARIHTAFAGPGWIGPPYHAMLVTHIVLAAGLLPLALVTLFRAARGDFLRHRRIARWTLPVWLYVSVTGVLVYLMLYVIFPGGGG